MVSAGAAVHDDDDDDEKDDEKDGYVETTRKTEILSNRIWFIHARVPCLGCRNQLPKQGKRKRKRKSNRCSSRRRRRSRTKDCVNKGEWARVRLAMLVCWRPTKCRHQVSLSLPFQSYGSLDSIITSARFWWSLTKQSQTTDLALQLASQTGLNRSPDEQMSRWADELWLVESLRYQHLRLFISFDSTLDYTRRYFIFDKRVIKRRKSHQAHQRVSICQKMLIIWLTTFNHCNSISNWKFTFGYHTRLLNRLRFLTVAIQLARCKEAIIDIKEEPM